MSNREGWSKPVHVLLTLAARESDRRHKNRTENTKGYQYLRALVLSHTKLDALVSLLYAYILKDALLTEMQNASSRFLAIPDIHKQTNTLQREKLYSLT